MAGGGREAVFHEQRDGAVVVEDAAHLGGDAWEEAAVHVAALLGERAEHRRVSAGGVSAYEYLAGVYAVFVRVCAHAAYRAARVLYLRGERGLSRVAVLRYRDGEALFHDFVKAADRHIKILRLPRRALHVDEARIFFVRLVSRHGEQYVEVQGYAARSRVFDLAYEPHAGFVSRRFNSFCAFGDLCVFGKFFVSPFFYTFLTLHKDIEELN